MMEREVGISQCMIVKDEEDNIERALSWGKGIVSEQIVVDTGSTDRTVEIAKQMGANVYHFTWINDFAAAKNYALDKARYDWIIFLDADEYFLKEDAGKILSYVKKLQDTPCSGILAKCLNVDREGNILTVVPELRIFRNLPELRYRGRIHEYIDFPQGKLLETLDAVEDLSVYHTGYSEEALKKKDGRNLRLVQAELEHNPDDYRMLGYLGKEYMRMKEYVRAEDAFRRALVLIPENMEGVYNGTTSEIGMRFLLLLVSEFSEREADVMDAYKQMTKRWPEESDYDYIMGQYFISKGDFRTGKIHLIRAIGLLGRYGYAEKAMLLSAEIKKAYELLVVCCYNNGDLVDCVSYATMMLKEDPYLMGILKVMFLAFCRDGQTAKRDQDGAPEVLVFLKKIYDLQILKDRMFLLKAAQEARYEALVKLLRGTFSQEELFVLDGKV